MDLVGAASGTLHLRWMSETYDTLKVDETASKMRA